MSKVVSIHSKLDRVRTCRARIAVPHRCDHTMSISQKLKQFRQVQDGQCSEERIKAIYQMALVDLESEVISFGKAKMGVPFKTAFEDNRWTDWFVSTFETSTKESHVKYVAYVSKRLDAEINQEAIERKAIKSVAKPVSPKITKTEPPKMHHFQKEEIDGDESLSEFIPIMETTSHVEEQMQIMHEENQNLRGRMTNIEMAIQELIQHVKNLSPDN